MPARREHGRRRGLAAAVLVLVLYLLLALLGRELGFFGALSVWFPPAGLALAVGYLWGWRALPLVAVAEFTSGIVVFGIADTFTLPQMAINALGYATVYVTAAAVLRGRDVARRMEDLDASLPLLLMLLVASTLAAATFGVGMQSWAGLELSTPYARSVVIWWLGDTIGIATVFPVALLAVAVQASGWDRLPSNLRKGHPVTTAATLLLPTLLAVGVLAAEADAVGLLFVVIVPVAVVAVRHGASGMALATMAFSPGATWAANTFSPPAGFDRVDLQLLLLGVIAAGHLVGVTVDDRARVYAELAANQAHLSQAQALAGMGSFRYDVATDTSTWSSGLYRLYGRTPDAEPVTFDDYLAGVHPDDRARVAEVVSALLASPDSVEHEYRIVRADGTQRRVEARVRSRVDDTGRVTRLVGTCQDVTARKAADDALRAAIIREQRAAEEIARSERLQNDLLVGVSHEVRTPLTVALGLSETLQHPGMADRPDLYRRVTVRLQRNLRRLQHLLEDLLDTDRLQREPARTARQQVRLPDLMNEVLGDHDLQGHTLHVDLPSDPVFVDRGLVSRILHQLVANAVRYTDQDCPVWVRGERSADVLELVVEDTGPGVHPEARARVFRPFQQDLRVEHAPGTGVGLHLVARFAELHDGAAWVEDRPGGGASFHVRLRGVTVPKQDSAAPADE